jgi:hypothetical protein
MKPFIYIFVGAFVIGYVAIKIEEKFYPSNRGFTGEMCHVEVHAHGDLKEAILEQAECNRQETETKQETQDRHDREQERERERDSIERFS